MGGGGQSPGAAAGWLKWSSSSRTAHPWKEGDRKFSAGQVMERSLTQQQQRRLCSQRNRKRASNLQLVTVIVQKHPSVMNNTPPLSSAHPFCSTAWMMQDARLAGHPPRTVAKVNSVTFGWGPSQIASLHATADGGAALQHAARVISGLACAQRGSARK